MTRPEPNPRPKARGHHRYATALLFGAFAALGSADAKENQKFTSFIPKDETMKFIVANLDLASFRNSFGPRREPGQHYFASFGLKPTSINESEAIFDTEDWSYKVTILSRGDANGDGVEDLVIRFVDHGKGNSTYRTSSRYVVTRYAGDSRLIAIAFEPNPEH